MIVQNPNLGENFGIFGAGAGVMDDNGSLPNAFSVWSALVPTFSSCLEFVSVLNNAKKIPNFSYFQYTLISFPESTSQNVPGKSQAQKTISVTKKTPGKYASKQSLAGIYSFH